MVARDGIAPPITQKYGPLEKTSLPFRNPGYKVSPEDKASFEDRF
jgi:hypothetical protein